MEKISITDATEALQTFLSLRGRSAATHKGYLSDIRMMWQEMQLETIPLDDLEGIAARWLNSKKRLIAAKSTGRRITAVKALGLAYKRIILVDYSAPTPPRMDPHPLPGGQADLKKILEACDLTEHEVLVTLTGCCGERISEARAQVPDDFDLQARKVKIIGKGDKVRIVPVSDFAWRILLPVIVGMKLDGRGDEPMIAMGDRAARGLITALGVRAKISRAISSHDLRATFATEAYLNTKDIRAVQYLLGHASVTQTQLYVDSLLSAQQAAVNFMEDED